MSRTKIHIQKAKYKRNGFRINKKHFNLFMQYRRCWSDFVFYIIAKNRKIDKIMKKDMNNEVSYFL